MSSLSLLDAQRVYELCAQLNRSTWNSTQARNYLIEQKEKHFDPQVAEAFLSLEIDDEEIENQNLE